MSQKFEFVKILPKGSSPGLSEQGLPDLTFSREETAWTRFSSSLVSLHEVFYCLPSLGSRNAVGISRFSKCTLDRKQSALCVHSVDYIKCDTDLEPVPLGQHN